MSDSALNVRRHGRDLTIKDKDLLTGRDARQLIAQAFAMREQERLDAIRAFSALPWYRRVLARLTSTPQEVTRAGASQPAGASE